MYQEKYQEWVNARGLDAGTKKALAEMANDPEKMRDCFYRDLNFGTGGLRGILGAGSNRMNIYTVRKATQGLADYICSVHKQSQGVAIAFDSRHMSDTFAMETALVLCANGIKTYLYEGLRPTPQLSFTIRHLHCAAGVVITASHNPAAYNGYKVYAEDGGQITPPLDHKIISFVNRVDLFRDVRHISEAQAKEQGLLHRIGEDLDRAYLAAVKKIILRPEAIQQEKHRLKIVYTPLHGTGLVPVTSLLKECGFTQVYVVAAQAQPDGDFPTVKLPNPEDKDAFALALALAKEKDADLVLATDPDADRLGVYVKDTAGEYHALSGNLSGALLMEYELSQRQALQKLPADGAVVKTIVTGNISKKIAQRYHVKLIETLTGFKYIGEQIKRFEETNSHSFLFGYEESYGCLIGTHARDKDAVTASLALCEAAAWYQSQGSSLWQQVLHLYETYGYYMEDILTKSYPGEDGAVYMKNLMCALRAEPPHSIGSHQVFEIRDYLDSAKTGLPPSDVLYFSLDQEAWFCIRPSGTEPKLKLYVGVRGNSASDAQQMLADLKADLQSLL